MNLIKKEMIVRRYLSIVVFIIILVSSSLLISCHSDDNIKELSKKEINQQRFEKIYEPIISLDTAKFYWTILFQEILTESKDSLFKFTANEILDIKRKDNSYYASFAGVDIIVYLKCTKEQTERLMNSYDENGYFSDYLVVFKATGYNNLDFALSTSVHCDEEYTHEDNCEASVYLEYSKTILLNGILEDFLIKNY